MKVKRSSILLYFSGVISGAVATLLVVVIFSGGISTKEMELEAKRRDLEARMAAKGKVVYAIVDIPEGTLIRNNTLEEKELEFSRIPQDALTSSSLAAGRLAKYGISQGQIVSRHDLAPSRYSRY